MEVETEACINTLKFSPLSDGILAAISAVIYVLRTLTSHLKFRGLGHG